jgi:hypothetical protein
MYLDQRFGYPTQVSEEDARKYFEAHRDQFTRNGEAAHLRAGGCRGPPARWSPSVRPTAMTQWLQDLRRVQKSCLSRRSLGEADHRSHRRTHDDDAAGTSSELNPAWLTIGATLLRRRR